MKKPKQKHFRAPKFPIPHSSRTCIFEPRSLGAVVLSLMHHPPPIHHPLIGVRTPAVATKLLRRPNPAAPTPASNPIQHRTIFGERTTPPSRPHSADGVDTNQPHKFMCSFSWVTNTLKIYAFEFRKLGSWLPLKIYAANIYKCDQPCFCEKGCKFCV